MRALRALLLGALAGAVLAYVAAGTVALAVSAAGAELVVAVGPVVFLAVERAGDGSETTFGAGLAVLPLVCGGANAVAALIMWARVRDGPMA